MTELENPPIIPEDQIIVPYEVSARGYTQKEAAQNCARLVRDERHIPDEDSIKIKHATSAGLGIFEGTITCVAQRVPKDYYS